MILCTVVLLPNQKTSRTFMVLLFVGECHDFQKGLSKISKSGELRVCRSFSLPSLVSSYCPLSILLWSIVCALPRHSVVPGAIFRLWGNSHFNTVRTKVAVIGKKHATCNSVRLTSPRFLLSSTDHPDRVKIRQTFSGFRASKQS